MSRHARIVLGLVAVLCGLTWAIAGRAAVAGADLPASLSDEEFWKLSQEYSEGGGTFHSENYVSNEGRFQLILPDLISRARQNGLYLGVGPEQNFTYIANLHPRMAFIVDIRRGNLQEHLLYKALFEMSADRAEFLSRLFSRARPAGVGPGSTPQQLFAAYDATPATADRYSANLAAVINWLTKAPHHLAIDKTDRDAIDVIYKTAFFADGPELGYQLTGQGRNSIHPTYAELMSTDDGTGHQRSYLATEDNFQVLKRLETANLLVPVVGDFGGAKALRAVAKYAREKGAVVSAFYLSNVEQYLRQDLKTAAFCANVASLPLDGHSTFIRSTANRLGGGGGIQGGLGMFWLALGEMQAETASCAAAR
ncbi:MAG: hypothetical protein ABI634_13920 [Acidobacteriota bacterium]